MPFFCGSSPRQVQRQKADEELVGGGLRRDVGHRIHDHADHTPEHGEHDDHGMSMPYSYPPKRKLRNSDVLRLEPFALDVLSHGVLRA